MNVVKKAYCRTYQTVFKLALPVLPYRKPEILDGPNGTAALFKKKGIRRVLMVTDKSIRGFGITPQQTMWRKQGLCILRATARR